jgi:hypothetical protein
MRKIKYYVHYGRNTCKVACYTLADVNAAIAHLLKYDTPITGVTKA